MNKNKGRENLMRKSTISTAITTSLLLTVVSVQAATTHTFTNGTFTFYDATNAEVAAFGHNDVQGAFDLANGTGQFTTSTPFSGVT